MFYDEEELRGSGYEEIGTGIFVPDDFAYNYALERIEADEELKCEFAKWFYSRNWVREC